MTTWRTGRDRDGTWYAWPRTMDVAGAAALRRLYYHDGQRWIRWGPDLSNPSAPSMPYPVDPAQPWGPRWERQRPPGLPSTARLCGTRGSALPFLDVAIPSLPLSTGDRPWFARFAAGLLLNESSQMMGRPANSFDARPPDLRPPDKGLITAWGTWQPNRDYWRGLTDAPSYLHQDVRGPSATRNLAASMPWECSPDEEVVWPADRKARIWSTVRLTGGTVLDAALACRIEHSGEFRELSRFRERERLSWREAWELMEASGDPELEEYAGSEAVEHEREARQWLGT